MARKRKNHAVSSGRLQKFHVVSYFVLEGRLAPGSMLDPGLAPAGSMNQGLDQMASQLSDEGPSLALSRSLEVNRSGGKMLELAVDQVQSDGGTLRDRPAGEAMDSGRTRQEMSSTSNRSKISNAVEGNDDRTPSSQLEFSPLSVTTPDHSANGRWSRPVAGAGRSVAQAGFAASGLPLPAGHGQESAVSVPRANPDLGAGRLGANALQSSFSDSAWQAALSASRGTDSGGAAEAAGVDAESQHRLPAERRGSGIDRTAGQSRTPYAITSPTALRGPTTGQVRSPAEYDPMRGVLYSYASFPTVVTDMVKELTEDPATDDIAYVVVSSEAQRTTATNSFISAGANLSRVQFFIQPMNSVWIRDYGPHFVTVDRALAIVDSHYYPTRPLDNFIPTLTGDNNFRVPTYDMGVYFSGGNFQPGPGRSGFVTSLINNDNPAADGFDAALLAELHQKYLGIDTLHVLPQLPTSVDATGHIDMWMYLVDQNTVVISEFLPGSNATAIQITNNAVGYMQNLGFEVIRTPAWNSGGTHFTYANAFRVNNRLFVPVYGTGYKPGGNSAYNSRDDQAMAAWQTAAGPGVEVIPIQSSGVIPSAGAIHCIVMQVPRYIGNAPAIDLLAPSGGEDFTPGVPVSIEWSAIDTHNVDPVSIDIMVSYNLGASFTHVATTTDTGSYLWTPGSQVSCDPTVIIRVIATAANGKKTRQQSAPFSITDGSLSTLDFSGGAGVDKFAYGSQTATWANVNANSLPVSSQLTSTNYGRLATSNAVGGDDADTNRYIAPVPSPTSNESTHVFTWQLGSSTSELDQLDVLWEGYADYSTQVELYVWDRVAQNWGNGAGLTGVNRYMDSWAGNLDGLLRGSIRSDFSRYVDATGQIRFLVYTDRPGAVGSPGAGVETFHDYMSVTVKNTGACTA